MTPLTAKKLSQNCLLAHSLRWTLVSSPRVRLTCSELVDGACSELVEATLSGNPNVEMASIKLNPPKARTRLRDTTALCYGCPA